MPILKDLHIRITSKCNLNCLHCYAANWRKANFSLDYKTLKSVILQSIELGCKKVTFTGGEPLVNKDICETILFCLNNNLEIEIETNGILIDKILPTIGDPISNIEFAIGYDGKKMRGETHINRIISNIQELKKYNCDIKLQTVLTKINLDEMDEIFNLSKKENIKHRTFLAHSPNGNGKNISLFTTNEWLKVLKNVKENYPHVIVELPDVFSGGKQKKCGWGVHRCEIMPNGDVTSCAPITFNKTEFIAGNIKTQNLKEIWNSKHFTEIRSLKQSDFNGICAKCEYWKTCLGACRSISNSTQGNILAPHPFCVDFIEAYKDANIDDSLLEGFYDAKQWANNILSNCDFTPEAEGYLSLVEKQHKL